MKEKENESENENENNCQVKTEDGRILQLPLLHLNGSGIENLRKQLEDATKAIRAAEDALLMAGPHARDYYPLGSDAFPRALEQYQGWLSQLYTMRRDMTTIWLRIEEQDERYQRWSLQYRNTLDRSEQR